MNLSQAISTRIESAPRHLVDALFAPRFGANSLLRSALLIGIGVLALVAASKIVIPIWPVPATLQTFAVLSLGVLYGPRLGAGAIIAWLTLGALGANVFAAGAETRGLAYLTGATGGYLLGFLLAAISVGALAARGWDRSPLLTGAAMLIGNVVIYSCGLAWLATISEPGAPILRWGLYPFLAGDVLKIAIAILVFPCAWRVLRKLD